MKSTTGALLFLLVFIIVIQIDARTRQFILGADISWVDADLKKGQKFYDGSEQKDILEILKAHKFNCIRLRLFVDPTAKVPETSESPYSSQGYCGLEPTIAFGKKIKDAGLMFLLDFHYSDVWADPAKQYKPMSWRSLSYQDLVKKVRSYTKESLEAFKKAGALPDMVQVGNEIVGGMIWPDGSTSNMKQFAELVNAGIDGVKDVSDDIEIFIHSISNKTPATWLSNLIKAGVKVDRIDIYGLSYYEEWHGTPADLKKNLTDITKNHNVKIAVAEYAEVHEQVNDIVFNLPDEEGIGTFVWEPTKWHETLFDNGKTNSRIDLYPKLSTRYGNDTLPLKESKVANRNIGNVSQGLSNDPVWIDNSRNLHRGNGTFRGNYSIVDLQGRIIASSRTDGVIGSINAPAGSMYIICASDEKQHQIKRWLVNGIQ
jgi:arabinogalactan endo-1,4-beta-galactosidase